MDKPKLVLIEWEDAASPAMGDNEGPWKDEGAELVSVCKCRSVGYLAHEDKDQVVLVTTVAEDGGFTGDFAIPRGCIKKRKILK